VLSYLANVDKLLEMHRQSDRPDAIRALWKETFQGWRHEILSEKIDNVDDIVEKRWPLSEISFRRPRSTFS